MVDPDLRRTLRKAPPQYWMNHVKFAPDGARFTVKLRWRDPGTNWSDMQGVSLTIASDGTDIRVLSRGTSHVMWLAPASAPFRHRQGDYPSPAR